MATNTMHNMATLMRRLEAATSRLEDMATSMVPSDSTTIGGSSIAAAGVHTPKSQSELEPTALVVPPPLPPAVEAFDGLINRELATFANLSDLIGGLVAEQAAAVLRAFAAERKFIIVTTKARKPDIQSPVYMETLKDLQETFEAVDSVRVAHRGTPYTSHLATVSESIGMLGWVAMDTKPADYVSAMLEAAQYQGNRVIKEYKEKDPSHVEWVQAYYKICKSLIEYIKEFYPTGIIWNNKDGIDAKDALRDVEAGNIAGPPKNAAPLPPPPPPLPTFDGPPPPPPMSTNASKTRNPADMSAVFDQLSKGEGVTSGLRKVDPAQQTHKNPSLRAQSTAGPQRSDSLNSTSSGGATGRGKSPVPHRKPESMRTKKPARKALDGNKWIVENYDNPGEIVEIEAAISHSILITKCAKTTVRIVGKANAVSIDSSNGVSLIIDSLVSAVDVIKTPRFEMQVLGTLPTVLLDQVDGAQIYLGPDSQGTEVFSSKCTAVNISVPSPRDEGDYVECAVPEQIKTVISKGRAVSEIVEHAG